MLHRCRVRRGHNKTDHFDKPLARVMASMVAQTVKNPLAMQVTQLRSLGQEDTLEKKMATHSSILAWRIPWTEETGHATVHELQSVRPETTE